MLVKSCSHQHRRYKDSVVKKSANPTFILINTVKLGSALSHIKSLAAQYAGQSDKELADVALNLGFESRQTDSVGELIERAFALVQVASQRQLNMQHWKVGCTGLSI